MHLLITGGTGFLSRRVAAIALTQGHRVRLMGRDFAVVGDLLAAGAEPCKADLRDPTALPLALLLLTFARPSRRATLLFAACHAVSFAVFAQINRAYLNGATPPSRAWLVPLVQTILPAQVAAALVLPQRIEWRGHTMQVERGGGFRLVQRRDDDTSPA